MTNGGKFTAGVIETGGNLPTVLMTPAVLVANLPSVSLILVQICHWCSWHWRQICCGFRWHRWQILRGCCWYRWCILTCEYLHEIFENNRNDSNVIFRGLGKMVHGKNLKQKILWHCPFNPCRPFGWAGIWIDATCIWTKWYSFKNYCAKKRLSFTSGWAGVLTMAPAVRIMNRWAWPVLSVSIDVYLWQWSLNER